MNFDDFCAKAGLNETQKKLLAALWIDNTVRFIEIMRDSPDELREYLGFDKAEFRKLDTTAREIAPDDYEQACVKSKGYATGAVIHFQKDGDEK